MKVERVLGKPYVRAIMIVMLLGGMLQGVSLGTKSVEAQELRPEIAVGIKAIPTAVPDRYGFRPDVFRYVHPAEGVLANDEWDSTYEPVVDTGPTYGSLGAIPTTPDLSGLQPDGSFAYYPDPSWEGDDSFTYYLTDGITTTDPVTVLLTNSVTCSVDAEGPNDEPGQKDLTQLCRDTYYETADTELAVSWNWDEISLTGTNTDDACALFDTNADGMANYAVCATWLGNIEPVYSRFFWCNDTRNDRCAGKLLLDPQPPSFSCAMFKSEDDPFNEGDQHPFDAKAVCYIPFTEGFGVIDPKDVNFLDVCSFPSAQPNSDPSDCIVKVFQPSLGSVKVIKDVEPAYPGSKWQINILDSTSIGVAEDVLNGDDETSIYNFTPGAYTITESAMEGTVPGFSTTYSCTNIGVTPVITITSPVGDLHATQITDLPIAAGDRWECTFNNDFTTNVELLSFSAAGSSKTITVQWETASEVNNLGFNLYRAASLTTAPIKLNKELIPTSVPPGSLFGAEYSFVDGYSLSRLKTYYYWLETVDIYGSTALYGPVTARLSFDFFQPSIKR